MKNRPLSVNEKLRGICLSALLFVLACLLPSVALAVSYSADMVSYVDQKPQMTGRIYVSGKKVRVEMGSGMVAITRPDKSVVWILMPAQKTYMERPIKPQDMATAGKTEGEVKKTYLGEESVEGRTAKKYRVTYRYEGKTEVFYSWIDTQLNVPLKVSDEKGRWMTVYKNIKPGSQPGSLFEVPAGYRKIKIPAFASGPPSFIPPAKNGAANGTSGEGPAAGQNDTEKKKITLPGGIKIPRPW